MSEAVDTRELLTEQGTEDWTAAEHLRESLRLHDACPVAPAEQYDALRNENQLAALTHATYAQILLSARHARTLRDAIENVESRW